MQPRAIGFAWYSRENYSQVRAMFKKADQPERRYETWLASAEAGFKRFTAQGYTVVRVNIDTVDFPAWCKANGHRIDRKGRTEYAAFMAREYLRAGGIGH